MDLIVLFLQKKKFDSADYFKEHENLKNAAGLGDGEEEKKEWMIIVAWDK